MSQDIAKTMAYLANPVTFNVQCLSAIQNAQDVPYRQTVLKLPGLRMGYR